MVSLEATGMTTVLLSVSVQGLLVVPSGERRVAVAVPLPLPTTETRCVGGFGSDGAGSGPANTPV